MVDFPGRDHETSVKLHIKPRYFTHAGGISVWSSCEQNDSPIVGLPDVIG